MKTVFGLFDDFEQAKKAALALESVGIPHDAVSIVANKEGAQPASTAGAALAEDTGHAVGHDATVGAEIGGIAGLFMGLTAIAVPGIGWIVGTGWLIGIGAGIGAIAGGLAGALAHAGVPHEEAAVYQAGVQRGGTLLAVKAEEESVGGVEQILRANGAADIEERAAASADRDPAANKNARLS